MNEEIKKELADKIIALTIELNEVTKQAQDLGLTVIIQSGLSYPPKLRALIEERPEPIRYGKI